MRVCAVWGVVLHKDIHSFCVLHFSDSTCLIFLSQHMQTGHCLGHNCLRCLHTATDPIKTRQDPIHFGETPLAIHHSSRRLADLAAHCLLYHRFGFGY